MGSQAQVPDDKTLLRRIAHGDTEAFDAFYQRYNAVAYTYILRLVHDPQVAEDLLQETFLAVWQGAHRFAGRSQVKTWLLSIAHHHAIAWYRANHNGTHHVDMEQLEDLTYTAGLSDAFPLEEIQEALDRLTPEHRAVLELAFYHDLSYGEIALILDCPVGTVKSRLNAARRQLQALLAYLYPDKTGGAV